MEYSDDFYNFYLFFQKAKEDEAMTLDWERVEGVSWRGSLGVRQITVLRRREKSKDRQLCFPPFCPPLQNYHPHHSRTCPLLALRFLSPLIFMLQAFFTYHWTCINYLKKDAHKMFSVNKNKLRNYTVYSHYYNVFFVDTFTHSQETWKCMCLLDTLGSLHRRLLRAFSFSFIFVLFIVSWCR